MRHRKRGRVLGRSPSHRKAMLRNLASSMFLTERETDPDLDLNIPQVKGRVITTLQKAKEVRSLVEKCITIARRSLGAQRQAETFATDAEPHSDQWRKWRNSEQWQQWNRAIAPAVAARRRVLRMLGDKEAVGVLFEEIAPRFEERNGGYTRVLRLAKPRLGDAGTRAVLEFVGVHDRVKAVSERPAFETLADDEAPAETAPETAADEQAQADAATASEPQAPADEADSAQNGDEEQEKQTES